MDRQWMTRARILFMNYICKHILYRGVIRWLYAWFMYSRIYEYNSATGGVWPTSLRESCIRDRTRYERQCAIVAEFVYIILAFSKGNRPILVQICVPRTCLLRYIVMSERFKIYNWVEQRRKLGNKQQQIRSGSKIAVSFYWLQRLCCS